MAKQKAGKPVDEPTGTVTTGHVWDGIRELDTPLPRWWLWLFYATIVWAVIYWVLFPAWPMLKQATPGVLGYSSRQDVETDLRTVAAGRAVLDEKIAALSFDEIRADPALMDHARRSGASAFKIACVQCHGTGAEGSQKLGYPNLNDDDWLWGGTPEEVFTTISHGVRDKADPKSRSSAMPAYGALGLLKPDQISDVADYVLSLAGTEHDAAAAERGAAVYNAQCFACHGKTGEGNKALGAPALRDAIWLYGGSHADIVAQVTNPRMGMMPSWSARFGEADRKKLALYVHSLGGGE
jgi:cytochrome c oxidase cbb3-type subunit 3